MQHEDGLARRLADFLAGVVQPFIVDIQKGDCCTVPGKSQRCSSSDALCGSGDDGYSFFECKHERDDSWPRLRCSVLPLHGCG